MLNPELEVKIGGSIFKILNENTTIEITDGSIDVLQQIRINDPYAFVSDVVVIHNHDAEPDAGPNGTQQFDCIKSDIEFTYTVNGNSVTVFRPASNSSCGYTIDFGDGSPKVDVRFNFNYTHTYTNSGSYVVTYENECPGYCVERVVKEITTAPINNTCTTPPTLADAEFTYTTSNRGMRYTFTTKTNNSNYKYTWIFGDGKIETTTTNTVTHDFLYSGTYPVTVIVSTNNGCLVRGVPEIITISSLSNCCQGGYRQDPDKREYDNGTRRIKSKIWSHSSIIYRRVGAKTKNFEYRRGGLFGRKAWRDRSAAFIHVQIDGEIFTEKFNGECQEPSIKNLDQYNGVHSLGLSNSNKVTIVKEIGDPFWVGKESIRSSHYVSHWWVNYYHDIQPVLAVPGCE